ncbi:DUF3019 domain-containing protein [Planctobacterium marinum]|uniref:DUF3019 domain-containing protein n=1 Tax=Planctobacterium marinum TaxID=1631968 RepID=UPI0030C770E4
MPATASPEEWQIAPSTCFTDKPGGLCRLSLNINLPRDLINTRQEVCFVLGDTLLRCIRSDLGQIEFTLELTQSTELQILVDGQLSARKILQVQSLTPSSKRRRVRNPWSFF